MRFRKLPWLVPLSVSFTLASGLLVANPSVPYGEALVDRSSFDKAPENLIPKHPGISDDLYALVEGFRKTKSAKARQELKQVLAKGRAKPILITKSDESGDWFQVYIYTTDKSERTIKYLEGAGVEIELLSPSRNLVQGFVSVDRIEELAELDCVREVRRPSYALATAGAVLTQGDALQATNLLRFMHGVDGSGVNVAIASTGLFDGGAFPVTKCNNSLHASSNGALPPSQQTELPMKRPGFTANTSCDALPNFGFYGGVPIYPPTLTSHVMDTDGVDSTVALYPEGSAIMEVVHDVAPGAWIYYLDGRTSVSLENSRAFIFSDNGQTNTRNIDVVIENVVFTDDGRFDGSSAISRGATEFSRKFNVPFLVSVGGVTPPETDGKTFAGRFPLMVTNFFNGDPRDNRQKVHSWGDSVSINRDEGLNVELSNGGALDVTLVWDDFWDDDAPRARTDLDLYLVPRNSLDISQAFASSARVQNGSQSNPIEKLTYFNDPGVPLALVIVKKDNGKNDRTLFTLIVEQGAVTESKYLTHGTPLNNADALPPVISVGDINLSNSFTALSEDIVPGVNPGSINPSKFVKWYTSQDAPTVVGYSSINTYTTSVLVGESGRSFTGPSAAVAHLGGFVTMLRHRFPEMPAMRIRQVLTDTSGRDDEGNPILPLAVDLTPNETETFENAPQYRKPNPYSIFTALTNGYIDPYTVEAESVIDLPISSDQLLLAGLGEVPGGEGTQPPAKLNGWNQGGGDPSMSYDAPLFDVSNLGLELTPTSDWSYGYWESPVLTIQGPNDAEPRSALSTDKLYVLEARVGSTETDPTKVPDFQLRVSNATNDESYMLKVTNETEGVANAPTTIGGNTYQLFFTPSNEQVAAGGFKFFFELMNTNPLDNADATLILRDVKLRELTMPEEETAESQD